MSFCVSLSFARNCDIHNLVSLQFPLHFFFLLRFNFQKHEKESKGGAGKMIIPEKYTEVLEKSKEGLHAKQRR